MSEIPEDVRFCRWVMGADALHAAAAEVPADMVLVSVVGIAGLQSVMDALGANRQVLLANKEALVTGGHLVMDAAKRIGKPILPGQRAFRHFPVLAGCRGQSARAPAADRVRRAVPHLDARTDAERDARAGAQAPELVNGRENHHRLGKHVQQGAGNYRGALAV